MTTALPDPPYPGKPGMTADVAAILDAVAELQAAAAARPMFRVEDRNYTADTNGDAYVSSPAGYAIAGAISWDAELSGVSAIGVTYGNKVRAYGGGGKTITVRFLFVRTDMVNLPAPTAEPAPAPAPDEEAAP